MGNDEKIKKPFYKKWWFWIIVVVVIICLSGNSSDDTTNNATNNDTQKNRVEVSVVDFSSMNRNDVQAWFENNKINGIISEEYSDTIEKGQFVSQSIAANTIAHEGDKMKVIYSLGKEPTIGQKNALKKAESYSKMMHMSKSAIYNQLTSEYGEGFTIEEAQYAIDNISADWKANALEKAKSYQTNMSMSKSAIYKQLTSEYGEKFTAEEAQYAIDNLEN